MTPGYVVLLTFVNSFALYREITSIHRQRNRLLLADLFVIKGERGWARYRASMKMHVLPFVVPLVPHAALLALLGMRYALSEDQIESTIKCTRQYEISTKYYDISFRQMRYCFPSAEKIKIN